MELNAVHSRAVAPPKPQGIEPLVAFVHLPTNWTIPTGQGTCELHNTKGTCLVRLNQPPLGQYQQYVAKAAATRGKGRLLPNLGFFGVQDTFKTVHTVSTRCVSWSSLMLKCYVTAQDNATMRDVDFGGPGPEADVTEFKVQTAFVLGAWDGWCLDGLASKGAT